jgi:hypothetical protein
MDAVFDVDPERDGPPAIVAQAGPPAQESLEPRAVPARAVSERADAVPARRREA